MADISLIQTILIVIGAIWSAFLRRFVGSPKKDLKGKVALVTGGGSGIGKLTSLSLAKKGCVLVLWDINNDSIRTVAEEIKTLGGVAHYFQCDISSREKVYEVAEKVKSTIGQVDILINCAGIVTGKKFLECSDDLIIKTFQINTLAHFWTVKAFIPSMIQRNLGHIVTIASCAGLVGVSGLSDYCASKFAVVGFDESLRCELKKNGKNGVKTTCVCPYYINTGMFDGVKTRFPSLLPILDPNYVADRITSAIETGDEEVIIMPSFSEWTPLLRFLLPIPAFDAISTYFGVNSSMDEFIGRK